MKYQKEAAELYSEVCNKLSELDRKESIGIITFEVYGSRVRSVTNEFLSSMTDLLIEEGGRDQA